MLDTERRNEKTKNIDKMSTIEMIDIISEENYNAVKAVEAERENIALAIDAISESLANGGRLFYIGAGTSGRLGVVDASECPPTFGVEYGLVTGIIAGGYDCMFKAAENAEDVYEKGEKDIIDYGAKKGDVVVGVSAAGGAAYVVGALEKAKKIGCVTVGLTCNKETRVLDASDIKICTQTGPEVITGSTRMKAGTAQKLVLNMLSTCAMVKTGKVYENLMINLKPTNIKLKDRMVRIVCEIKCCDYDTAEKLLNENNWVIRDAVK